MRKIMLFGSLLAASMLAIGGAAYAVAPTGTFDYKVVPGKTSTTKTKGKKAKKQSFKIDLGSTFDPLPGAVQPPSIIESSTQFDDMATIDTRAIKGTAKLADVQKTGDCSSKYRWATGKAVGHANPLIPTIQSNLNVCIIERDPGDVVTIVLGANVPALQTVIAIKSHLKLKNGKPLLVVPGALPQVVGVTPVISSLSAKTKIIKRKIGKGKKKTVYLLNAATTCKKDGKKVKKGQSGFFTATQTTTFVGADPLVLTAQTKCVQM